jgi:hypothetical protein
MAPKGPITAEQRHELSKYGEELDRISAADRVFFERFPHRNYRIRHAGEAEIKHLQALEGKPNIPSDWCAYTVVHNVKPGTRTKLFVYTVKGMDLDVSDEVAGMDFKHASSPHSEKVEAAIRGLSD